MKMIGQKPIVIHSTSLWVWNNVSGTFSRFICTVSWSLAEPVLFDYCPRPCMQAGMGDSVMPCSATKTGNMAIWQHLTNMTACGKLVACQVVTQQTTLLLCAFQTGQGPIEVCKCLNCLTPNSVIWVCQAIVEKFDLVQKLKLHWFLHLFPFSHENISYWNIIILVHMRQASIKTWTLEFGTISGF